MSKKTLGIVLVVVGVIVVIASLGADAFGFGGSPGLGWKQALGAVVGVITVAVGAWFWPGLPTSLMSAEGAGSRRALPARKPRTAKKSPGARKSARRRK
jgi:hypothetical protein